MNNKKYNYLVKNTALFTISSFGSKILGFLLIPLYTNVLSTADYGTADLLSITVSFLIPCLTLSISSAVMRFSINDPENSGPKLKYGIVVTIRGSIILVILLCATWKLKLMPWSDYYYIFLLVLFIAESFEGLLSQYLRAIDKVYVMVISSLISTCIRLILNIMLMVFFHCGIIGYLVSMLVAVICSVMYSAFYTHPLKIFISEKYSKSDPFLKDMRKYAIPAAINTISWSIANGIDKYFVTWMKGASLNGIYSVSYKIPSIMTMLCNIFSQAWGLSAIKEYQKDDSDGFFGKTYSVYNAGLVISCSLLILINIPLAKFLFAKNFFEAWKYSSLLILSMIFSALSSFLGGIFNAAKKNGVLAMSTVSSAIINIALNICLIPKYGALGAAIATMISFYAIWMFRFIASRNYIIFKVNLVKDHIVYALIILQIIFEHKSNHFYIGQFSILILIVGLYYKQLKTFMMKVLGTVWRKKRK